jgi:putative sigma-54 modulation protein
MGSATGLEAGGESVEIKISARHGHLSEDTQQFIRDKAQKLLRLFDRLTMIAVTVDLKDDLNKVVEFLVLAEHKHDFVATETNPDILTAIDLVMAKLEQQLRKYKEKLKDRRRRPAAGEVPSASPPPSSER